MLAEVNNQTPGDLGGSFLVKGHQEGQGRDLSPQNRDQGVLRERRENNAVLGTVGTS